METVAVDCADHAGPRQAACISDVRTAYDGGAYGAAPTKGDETASATLKKHDGTNATYLESGRYLRRLRPCPEVTDLTADVTATDGSHHRSHRARRRPDQHHRLQPGHRVPDHHDHDHPAGQGTGRHYRADHGHHPRPAARPADHQKDTNNKTKNFTYDALGRADKVWLANRSTSQTPSYDFDYFVEEGKPAAVRTQTLNNEGAPVRLLHPVRRPPA